jgi:hypothetical protein
MIRFQGFYHNEENSLNLDKSPTHNLLKVTWKFWFMQTAGWQSQMVSLTWIIGPLGLIIRRFSELPFQPPVHLLIACISLIQILTSKQKNRPKSGVLKLQCQVCACLSFLKVPLDIVYLRPWNTTTIPTWESIRNTELLRINSPDPVCDESGCLG